MAAHRTTCPSCKKVFKVKLEMQGKRCKCAKCQTKFVINIDTPIDQIFDSPDPPPPAQPSVVQVQEQFETPPSAPVQSATPVAADDEVVAVVTTTATPATPTPGGSPVVQSSMGGLLDQAAKTPSGATERVKGTDQVSSFEKLASKLVSAREEANEHAVYDPRKFMAYSTNANLVSKDSTIEKSTRMVIRGGALMLFAMMLIPLVLLGFHLTGSKWTCPLGGILASFLGCIGALLTAIGLRSKIGSAMLFGGGPGVGFLLVGSLVVLLFMNDYWGSGLQLFPKGFGRSRSISPSNDWRSRQQPFSTNPSDRSNRAQDPFERFRVEPPKDPFEGLNRNQINDPFEGLNRNRQNNDPFNGFNNNRGMDPLGGSGDPAGDAIRDYQKRINRSRSNNFGTPPGTGVGGQRWNPGR